MSKVCSECFRYLPGSEFRARVKKQNGTEYRYSNPTCRKCEAEYQRSRPRAVQNETLRRWRGRNPERVRELGRKNFREQHEKHLAKMRNRRAKIRYEGVVTEKQWAKIVTDFGGVCAYCGGPYEEQDHVQPLSRGGVHRPANVVPSCQDCNRSKGSQTVLEWIGCGETVDITESGA